MVGRWLPLALIVLSAACSERAGEAPARVGPGGAAAGSTAGTGTPPAAAEDVAATRAATAAERRREAERIALPGVDALGGLSRELEGWLANGRLDLVQERFATAEALAGCTLTRGDGPEDLAASLDKAREELTRLGFEHIARRDRARPVHRRHRVVPGGAALGGRLAGDGCPVRAAGEVHVLAVRDGASEGEPPAAVDHAFSLALLADGWAFTGYGVRVTPCGDEAARGQEPCRTVLRAAEARKGSDGRP